ncbi:Dihydroorotate dehydrogenase (quinone) protein [Thalictrum thalictroides]|uniref:Dihydroorotate dehydrogenase (quinone), mitochondrial n=1 Tax=Thalictrum thalictroides TaxID=46969 RepID=A0A7J6VUX7_THATH|nr:Dihydroorotate dehydrogenase (quinone) protein [Thalictrum thalictroides]
MGSRKLVRDLFLSKQLLHQLIQPHHQVAESRLPLISSNWVSSSRRFSVRNESSKKPEGEARSSPKFKQSINELKEKAAELKLAKEELKMRTKQTTENLYKRVDGAWKEAEASLKKGRLLTGATISLLIAGGAYASTVDEATFCGWLFNATKLVNPFFAFLDAEVAHHLAITAASRGWVPREKRPDPSILGLEVWGRKFSNPIGLAAGFDKNAVAVEGLLGLGFGFVEVGSVTPIPQDGNPKPRIFRLREEGAIINRCGFNSEGIVSVAKRLGAQHGKRKLAESTSTSPAPDDEVKHQGKAGPGILGVNLGKNKTSEDAAADYVQGVHTLSQYADYLVINISSPNTPGLRKLQGRKQLKDLIKKVQAARDEMQWGEEGPPPLLVKIAPDLSKQDLEDIAAVALTLRLDGLIISNTTIARPDPVSTYPVAGESGGLSGKPLFTPSTTILNEMYILTRGRIPLIGCGGVSSGEDAYKKIRAGASLVQLYTAFAYGGPALIPQIKAELAECLERDGFKSVHEAIGADCR